MHILGNIGKSSLLAASIFWIIILSDTFNWDMVPYIFISLIPIYVICALTILITICPIFWFLENDNYNKQRIFKTYFPIYTTLMFSLCAYSIYKISTDIVVLSFFISAYITTVQSWVWFTKEKVEIK
ncbi:hypothetical protein [Pontimicrobium aquaticum]|uniref:Uncharacterized protein n=1 Tax=Pontimicrobium aquaticum TaxID=2565367 RepID=A0A4U0EWT6_9FLAO|nr:hypothetical protein [Pontimicrobium aquaticum]TJY36416.1 hypothetical protein E5167_07070 [Pontimicrobium aquaticum]